MDVGTGGDPFLRITANAEDESKVDEKDQVVDELECQTSNIAPDSRYSLREPTSRRKHPRQTRLPRSALISCAACGSLNRQGEAPCLRSALLLVATGSDLGYGDIPP